MPEELGRCVVLDLGLAQFCLILLLRGDKVQGGTGMPMFGADAKARVRDFMRGLESRAHFVQVLLILPISDQHVFPKLSVRCCQHHKYRFHCRGFSAACSDMQTPGFSGACLHR